MPLKAKLNKTDGQINIESMCFYTNIKETEHYFEI